MRTIRAGASIGLAIAGLFIVPSAPMSASAHADLNGYSNCVARVQQVPLWEHDPQNMQLIGVVEQDLNSGVPPAAEAKKVERMGFDSRLANRIVECVIQEHP